MCVLDSKSIIYRYPFTYSHSCCCNWSDSQDSKSSGSLDGGTSTAGGGESVLATGGFGWCFRVWRFQPLTADGFELEDFPNSTWRELGTYGARWPYRGEVIEAAISQVRFRTKAMKASKLFRTNLLWCRKLGKWESIPAGSSLNYTRLNFQVWKCRFSKGWLQWSITWEGLGDASSFQMV